LSLSITPSFAETECKLNIYDDSTFYNTSYVGVYLVDANPPPYGKDDAYTITGLTGIYAFCILISNDNVWYLPSVELTASDRIELYSYWNGSEMVNGATAYIGDCTGVIKSYTNRLGESLSISVYQIK
jgi:hypothetical protein